MKNLILCLFFLLVISNLYSQQVIHYTGERSNRKLDLIKIGNKWTISECCFWSLTSTANYVQIKSDEHYYYIGQSQAYLDSLEAASKKNTQESNDEEGFIFEENLPSQELSGQYQTFAYADSIYQLEESKKHLIQKSFKGYIKVLRIPIKGGWVQKIGDLRVKRDGDGYIINSDQDEWWNDFQVKLSFNK